MNREEYFAAIREYKEIALQHWGILGMKWGIRRYQNPDGSLTPEGRARRAEQAAKFRADKEKAIKSGNAKFAYKHFDKFSDKDYERLSAVINKKMKYSDLVNKAERIKTDRLRNATDRANIILQTTNNLTGFTNNILSLVGKLTNKGNNDRFEAVTVDAAGKAVSKVSKFTASDGTKMSVTTLYNKNEPKSSSEVNKSWSFATDDKKKKK